MWRLLEWDKKETLKHVCFEVLKRPETAMLLMWNRYHLCGSTLTVARKTSIIKLHIYVSVLKLEEWRGKNEKDFKYYAYRNLVTFCC